MADQESKIITLELSEPQTMCATSRQPLTLNMAGQRAGKSQMIGIMSGDWIQKFPRVYGFIGANTYLQLSQSTLVKATEIWRDYYQMKPYDKIQNPHGSYVIDRRPPPSFKTFETFKQYNNIISFKNGGVIYIGSLDNYMAHDGKEFGWAHLDETKDTKEVAVTSVILARLSQAGLYVKEGDPSIYYIPKVSPDEEPDPNTPELTDDLIPFNPSYIHTSPAIGGVDWLVKMFELDKFEKEIRETIVKPDDFFYKEFGRKAVNIFSTYHNAKNLPRNYIEGRLDTLSDNEAMKFVYGYPFSKTGGEYYPAFSRARHVRRVEEIENIAKHISWDFNVMPYMTLVDGQIRYKIRYIDENMQKHDEPAEGRKPIEVMIIEFIKEFCLASPRNTSEACCDSLLEYHVGNPYLEFFYYGDSTGRNRIAGLGSLNNYKIIADRLDAYLFEGSDRVPKMNMGVLTRRDLMNRVLEGKYPEIELYFDEEMTETIRDFEFLKLGATGKLKEKAKDPQTGAMYEKIGHTSDAVEYLVCEILKDYVRKR